MESVLGSPPKVLLGKHETVRFNILVVGETSQGKTTFLQSMLRAYCVDQDLVLQNKRGLKVKGKSIVELGVYRLDTDTAQVCIHLHEIPGYGDAIDNTPSFDGIREDLVARHRSWRSLDAQLLTEQQRLSRDSRIHCLLYFLAPGKFKILDEKFIKNMSDIVPIVPIVSKADTMTLRERRNFLLQIQTKLDSLSESVKRPVIYDFNEALHTSTSDESFNEMFNSHPNNSFSSSIGVSHDSVLRVGEAMSSSIEAMEYQESMVGQYSEVYEIMSCKDIPPAPGSKSSDEQPVFEDLPEEEETISRVPNIFAVICDESGSRKYPWGSIDIHDPKTSDFRRLQELLFEKGVHIRRMKDLTQEKMIILFKNHSAKKLLDSDIDVAFFTIIFALLFEIILLNTTYLDKLVASWIQIIRTMRTDKNTLRYIFAVAIVVALFICSKRLYPTLSKSFEATKGYLLARASKSCNMPSFSEPNYFVLKTPTELGQSDTIHSRYNQVKSNNN